MNRAQTSKTLTQKLTKLGVASALVAGGAIAVLDHTATASAESHGSSVYGKVSQNLSIKYPSGLINPALRTRKVASYGSSVYGKLAQNLSVKYPSGVESTAPAASSTESFGSSVYGKLAQNLSIKYPV